MSGGYGRCCTCTILCFAKKHLVQKYQKWFDNFFLTGTDSSRHSLCIILVAALSACLFRLKILKTRKLKVSYQYFLIRYCKIQTPQKQDIIVRFLFEQYT